jgi:hypothetical protein
VGSAIVFGALIICLVVAAPIAAFVALARVRRLERRIADLEARPARVVAPPASPAP